MALLLKDYVPGSFNKMVNDLLEENMYQEKRTYVPKANILERDGEFEIQVVLPGFDKKEISLDVEKGVLTIRAEQGKTETSEKKPDEKEVKKHVVMHLNERVSGPFKRSFQLPENIKEDKIKASYENGILIIQLLKDKVKQLKKAIEVK